METFTIPRELVHNPRYGDQRNKMLAGLSNDMIDDPIIDIVNGFNRLPCCFTVQCCYGHFTHYHQKNPHNFEPIPAAENISSVKYGLAYICFCIDNTYALQVMPDRFKTRDSALLDYVEALHIEKTRNAFFTRLREMLQQP